MTSRLRRPAGALVAGALAVSALAFIPAANAAPEFAHITGNVTTDLDVPLEDVRVAALQNLSTNEDEFWQPVAFARTDENGFYDLEELEEGTYRVEFGDRLNPGLYASEFYNDQASGVFRK